MKQQRRGRGDPLGIALIKAEGECESVASAGKPCVVPHYENCSGPPPSTSQSPSAS